MNLSEVREVYEHFRRNFTQETSALLTVAAYLDDLGDVLLPGFRGKDEIDRHKRIKGRSERESR